MINNEWVVKVKDAAPLSGHRLWIFQKTFKGTATYNGQITTEHAHGEAVDEKESIFLSDDMLKALIDAIHKNFKPSEGKFTEGKLEATEKHLEDMRKLVFNDQVINVAEVRKEK